MFRYIVPDSCSLGAAYFNEPHAPHAAPLLAAIRLGHIDALGPTVCVGEFLNICRRKIGEGVAPSDVDAVVADFLQLPIVWFDVEPLFAGQSWQWHRTASIGTNDAFSSGWRKGWEPSCGPSTVGLP